MLYIFQISKPLSLGPGWDSNSQPSDLWANTQGSLPRSVARGQLLTQGFSSRRPVDTIRECIGSQND